MATRKKPAPAPIVLTPEQIEANARRNAAADAYVAAREDLLQATRVHTLFMPATNTAPTLFHDPKPGDRIAIPRSHPYSPICGTIASVTQTRITDNHGVAWRRADGRKVGSDRYEFTRPWTEADAELAARESLTIRVRNAAGRLDHWTHRTITSDKVEQAATLLAAIDTLLATPTL